MTEIRLSLIIPVYNRPDEIEELLESFTKQDFQKEYEIVIVEDGSSLTSEEIVQKYKKQLNITYFYKENSGPGDSRNYGMMRASGNYFIILDSDVILPSHYLSTIDTYLTSNYLDCFGGSDAAHDSFTDLQKAINYVMTSFFTTGGIRGGKMKVQKFEPRSFNMGISKEAFEATEGFSKIHPGEDPDLSQRIVNKGFKTGFLPNAYVYHKRRISWKKFHTQVKKFGLVRPILTKWHPTTAKITFWFPGAFVLFTILSVLLSIVITPLFIAPLAGYLLLLFLHSMILNKSIKVAFLSIYAVFVQFFGYGLAFLKSTFYIRLLNRDPQKQFPKLFFK
ncbi:glycosyltransferase [Tenacibaculum sp. M341]|uniref:glycosyltransferase n=1 Tax=Tenacibaculum sp. M341 TaxID=2530339 RepID=UPI00104FF44C|nr:glycosyltransferase [Tenacibaculum sp. M341]TCI94868.1 glycosyltransferase [Tenacibaculum sp. M341]